MARENGLKLVDAHRRQQLPPGAGKDLRNDITDLDFATQGDQEVTNLDKSAIERIYGLVDFSIHDRRLQRRDRSVTIIVQDDSVHVDALGPSRSSCRSNWPSAC